MSTLASILQSFFTDRLHHQRQASIHTIAAYRDAVKLLLVFASATTGKQPSDLNIADLDAPLIGAFLDHLETDRANSVRTRNARLAAIHALFRHAAWHRPDDAAVIQRVLAIPPKRFDRTIVTYLTEAEITALLDAPDPTTWTGRRDRALLMLACQTGLRASELIGLTIGDLHLGTGAHVSCLGKGRKQRITPLTPATVTVVRGWLTERAGQSHDPLFPTRRGTPLSRDGLERRLATHVATATQSCPTLRGKKISPHVLRHSTAMRLLHAGVDTSVIALWLGHENVATTQIYIHADLAIKEKALARTAPQNTTQGRYQPNDDILAFLESL
ncbi:tyrosine-type recombinase/integrase [Frankia sp. Cj3]|uniref:tyrosine-type recombinase/integrase n=1 Tax=Frankia sp. Cj3 TaxID=2880976 RepID=UPI001EF5C7B5|nr:tyrosine-type recombinase/integrase [Frankia sp. Cj3]